MTLFEWGYQVAFLKHLENDVLGKYGLRNRLIPEDDEEFTTLNAKEKRAVRRHNRDVSKALRGFASTLENLRKSLRAN